MTCANCPKESARRSALCWRCLKYRQRHGRLPEKPPQTYANQWETLKAAARAAEALDTSASDDAAFARTRNNGPVRTWQRLRVAAIRYAESLGYRKPRNDAAEGEPAD